MHNNKPYSFEKTDVRGLFLLNFSCTKVQSKYVSPIAGNVERLCVGGASRLKNFKAWGYMRNAFSRKHIHKVVSPSYKAKRQRDKVWGG